MNLLKSRVRNLLAAAIGYLIDLPWRRIIAYALMGIFIVFSSIGAGLIFPPAGWIAAGIASGLVGYLLGAD